MAEPDIQYLFKPRGIAVIGASRDSTKIGYKILDNILSGGYQGRIYPVNPKGEEILGLRGYKDIREIEDEVDVGVIVVPATFVLDVVKGCAEKGVKFTPIISSGFSEMGNREEEKKIVDCARETRHARPRSEHLRSLFGFKFLERDLWSQEYQAGKYRDHHAERSLGHRHDRKDHR